MDYSDYIIFIMEILGTIAFASSGAMVGIEKKMDIFGVNVLGITTAVGGGLIRDIILSRGLPAMFRKPVYTVVAVITSTAIFAILYVLHSDLPEKFRSANSDKKGRLFRTNGALIPFLTVRSTAP